MGAHHARWYVYELVDPRDGLPFYVGKGCGKRMEEHEADARRGVCSKKCNRIKDIWSDGLTIERRKVANFWDEQAAYDHETDRIDQYGLANLTNILPGGQMAWDRRRAELCSRRVSPMQPIEIARKMAPHIAWWIRAGKPAAMRFPGPYGGICNAIANAGISMIPKWIAAAHQQDHQAFRELLLPYGIEYGSA